MNIVCWVNKNSRVLFVCVYAFVVSVALVSTRGTFCQHDVAGGEFWFGCPPHSHRDEEEKESDIAVLISNKITWIYHVHARSASESSPSPSPLPSPDPSTPTSVDCNGRENNVGATMCSTPATMDTDQMMPRRAAAFMVHGSSLLLVTKYF